MARPSVIEKYGLERVANDLLAPKPDGKKRTLAEVTKILTERARKKALEENPDLAPSLLEEIAVTKQALLRYVERSSKAAQRIIERNDQMATDAAEAVINGLGTLLRVRKELWAIFEAKKRAVNADKDPNRLAHMDTLDVQRLLGRLESVGKELLDLELLGMNPDLFPRFLKVLDKGVALLFGQEAPDQLKTWLQDQDEFRDVAIALGWVKEEEEGALPDGGGGRMVN